MTMTGTWDDGTVYPHPDPITLGSNGPNALNWQDQYLYYFQVDSQTGTTSELRLSCQRWDGVSAAWEQMAWADFWTTASAPTSPNYFREGCPFALIGDYCYLFSAGGPVQFDGFQYTLPGLLHRYSILDDTWEMSYGESLPGFNWDGLKYRNHPANPAMYILGTDVHFFGGFKAGVSGSGGAHPPTNLHHVYHSSTNTWTREASPAAPMAAGNIGFQVREVEGVPLYYWCGAHTGYPTGSVNTYDLRQYEWDGDSGSSWVQLDQDLPSFNESPAQQTLRVYDDNELWYFGSTDYYYDISADDLSAQPSQAAFGSSTGFSGALFHRFKGYYWLVGQSVVRRYSEPVPVAVAEEGWGFGR